MNTDGNNLAKLEPEEAYRLGCKAAIFGYALLHLPSRFAIAPMEPFYLCMRFYGPKPEMLRGEYTIHPVVRRAAELPL
jgi:hypothetical protein